MASSGGGDFNAIWRGLLLLLRETAKLSASKTAFKWHTSSVNGPGIATATQLWQKQVQDAVQPTMPNLDKKLQGKTSINSISAFAPSEIVARIGVVVEGVSAYVRMQRGGPVDASARSASETVDTVKSAVKSFVENVESNINASSPVASKLLQQVNSAETSSHPDQTTFRRYDPIMDPNIIELDLEKILQANSWNAVNSTQANSTEPYEMLNFRSNEQLLEDLDVRNDAVSNNPMAAEIVKEVSQVVDDIQISIENTVDRVNEKLDTLQNDAHITQISQDQLDAVEQKLETLRGNAFSANIDTIKNPSGMDNLKSLSTSSPTNNMLENFDFNSNEQLLNDLDIPSNAMRGSQVPLKVDNIYQNIDDFQSNIKDNLNKSNGALDDAPDNIKFAEISQDQLDAIEQKLETIRGTAFAADMELLQREGLISDKLIEEEHRENSDTVKVQLETNQINNVTQKPVVPPSTPKLLGRKPLANVDPDSMLSASSSARAVPNTRISRLVSFGGLAAGLGMGTLAEMTRRTLGMSRESDSKAALDSSPFLTEANANRIVKTLCKVRGAALKLGQMLSLQDSAMINPHLQLIFERVRQSADFMPDWQLQRVMDEELGPNWREHLISFDEKPFAAASIGQVHQGVLLDGRRVAIKVQYPGVAEGINSDINNLISTLKLANILPEGMFMDNLITVAKRELAWECDYERELQCGETFAALVEPFPQYYVPAPIKNLSTKRVLTTELIEGTAVDKCTHLDQHTRNTICDALLELTTRELFQFGYMQTDPNWANFFYNSSTQQIALVDFGACRPFDKSFVDVYIEIIHGAATRDREKVAHYSRKIGFLTGHEAKVMVEAHVDAVLILGEAFYTDGAYSFGHQNATRRIQELVPTMLAHRMCPPPEEVYSLHRKLSGVFLLCSRLGGEVNIKPLFEDIYRNYKFGGPWPPLQSASSTF